MNSGQQFVVLVLAILLEASVVTSAQIQGKCVSGDDGKTPCDDGRGRSGSGTNPSSGSSELDKFMSDLRKAITDGLSAAEAEKAAREAAARETAERERAARAAEAARLEQQRLAAEARQREAERQERLARIHRTLLSQLQYLDQQGGAGGLTLAPRPDGLPLPLKGVDDANNDDGLRPAGTSFFGLGGGPGSNPSNEPPPVDLRNLRRGAYLWQVAAAAAPGDREFLHEEALAVADGSRPPFVVIDDGAVPVVSEAGLLAFQQANIDYKQARLAHGFASTVLVEADARLRSARDDLLSARTALEGAVASGRMPLAEQHRLMDNVFEAARRVRDEWLRAHAEMDAAASRMNSADAMRRVVLGGAPPPPPPPPPPPSSGDATRRTAPSTAATGDPVSDLPWDVLRREREFLEPSLADRAARIGSRAYGLASAENFDEDLATWYGFVSDPAAETAKTRLAAVLERIRPFSPYPDEVQRIKIVNGVSPDQTRETLRWPAVALGDTLYVSQIWLDARPSDAHVRWMMTHELAHFIKDHDGLATIRGHVQTLEALLNPSNPARNLPQRRSWDDMKAAWLRDFSQAQEHEANRLAAYLFLASGGRPAEITDFFRGARAFQERQLAGLTPAETRLRMLVDQHAPASEEYAALQQLWGKRVFTDLEAR